MTAIGEHWFALLESVLGATPREFESRILRNADQAMHQAGHAFGLGSSFQAAGPISVPAISA